MKQNSSQQKRKTKGFTLVELIVVIAILAILAGVGAVAYTGYIEHTKKGLDKQTVGEIMNALELADYDDPGLLEEGAIVYITGNGVSSGDANVNAALQRALGDLSAVKLNYEKWNKEEGSIDAAELNTLLEGMESKWDDSTSSINKYLENDGTASFAGNIEEYWEAVQDYINLFSNAYGEGATDPDKGYLLSAVVNESIDPTLASKYVDYFGKGGADEGLNHASKSFRAATVASNYAFAAWLSANHSADITTAMMENYNSLTTVGRNVLSFGRWASDPDWKPLIEEYYTTQGETDMLAYLGMLEAAKTMEPAEGRLKDEVFVPQAGKVVNVAAGVLSKNVDHTALETLAASLADSGSGSLIAVRVTKSNGQLSFHTNPPSADPRKDNGGSGSTTCDKTHTETLSVVLSNPIKVPGDIELCSVENIVCTVTFTMPNGKQPPAAALESIKVEATDGITIDQSNLKSTGQFTVTATKSGTITININKASATIKVNVH